MTKNSSEELRMVFVWGVIFGACVMIIAVFIFVMGASSQENTNDAKFNKCVDIAVKAVPDPNDTEARDSIIRNCYEVKKN